MVVGEEVGGGRAASGRRWPSDVGEEAERRRGGGQAPVASVRRPSGVGEEELGWGGERAREDRRRWSRRREDRRRRTLGGDVELEGE